MLFGVTVMTKEGMNLGTRIKPEPLVTHAVERQKKEELIKSFKRIAIRLKTEYKGKLVELAEEVAPSLLLPLASKATSIY